jgi:hypothetical protein
VFVAKGTLLVPSGPPHDPDRKHLHIVCNDTDASGFNLLVPVSSWINDLCDGTCVLLRHEHPWLTKPKSYVLYRNATLCEAVALQRGIQKSMVIAREDCNAQVSLRIRNGICNSPRTPRKIKSYYGCEA